MNINFKDYLSDEEIKEIVIDELRKEARKHFCNEKEFTRILTNISYYELWKKIEEEVPNSQDIIKEKVKEKLNEISNYDIEWRNIDYSKYDLVITNPPFSQVREFIRHLIKQNIDFIIIVSDVLRYSISKGKTDFDVKLYKGWDAQKFYRPDGSIKAIHCGWISTIQDDWLENKLLKEVSE